MSQRIRDAVEPKSSKIKPLTYVVISYVLSRTLFFYGGIRFDAKSLDFYWHFIDPELFRGNLFQSVYYLHGQPPLFNLFLGAVLKLFPRYETLVFHATYLVFGLTLVVSTFLLMTKLGMPSRLNVILTVLFLVSPACILYENWLFYTYPVTALLCLSALFLHRFLSSASLLTGITFFTLLSLVVLIRSIFHILWFAFFFCLLLFCQRHHWKRIILASCVPFLIIFLVYAKNFHLFGSFTTSTWLGMNFSRMTTFQLSEDEREALVSRGMISELSLIPPLSNFEAYRAHFPRVRETDVSVLDQEVKSTGAPNLHHIAYVGISRQYLRDATYVLISRPKTYLTSLRRSLFIFLFPANDYFPWVGNRTQIPHLDRFYNVVFSGQLCPAEPTIFYRYNTQKFCNIGLFTLIGYSISVFYGLRLVIGALSRKPTDLSFTLTVLFLWGNIVYVTLVSNALEMGENNRFRFMIDPFILIVFGLFLNHGLRKLQQYVTSHGVGGWYPKSLLGLSSRRIARVISNFRNTFQI